MTNYLLNRAAGVLSAIADPQKRESSTWTTIISVWLFAVCCVYAVIALLLIGWILIGYGVQQTT